MNSPTPAVFEILHKKKQGKKLTSNEIRAFVAKLQTKEASEVQAAAFLMACFIQGLDDSETAALTDAMKDSGSQVDFGNMVTVDKHSTGGVGDKASFILAPIAHACGVKVPMMAGRSLGHTGGTIDKAESIKGLRTNLGLSEFKEFVQQDGMALMAQTKEIAPADKLLYSLRDVTATIDSIPLITASIMSKKLAEGASDFIFDVKVGHGAFMREIDQATELAKSLVKTAKRCGRKASALITSMNWPLGQTIGNAIEIHECVEVLKGMHRNSSLTKLSIELAARMIVKSQGQLDLNTARKRAEESIDSGEALKSFIDLVHRQQGDASFPEVLPPLAAHKTIVQAKKQGHIAIKDCQKIGTLLNELGGGRLVPTDKIDHAVGFRLLVEQASFVESGSPLMEILHHEEQQELAKTIAQRISEDVFDYLSETFQQDLILGEVS